MRYIIRTGSVLVAVATCFASSLDALAQAPALPAPTPSSYTLELTQFGTHTGSHAIDVAAPHNGSGNVYVSAQSGEIFGFDSAGNSLGTFLDMAGTAATTGFQSGTFTPGANGAAFRGLMYFDFHPDFGTVGSAGEGKVYTGFKSSSGFGTVDYQAPGNGNQYVIAEWEVSDSDPNMIDTTSYREVMRLGFTGANPHAIGEIAFNPLANPGDDDYGLLYAAIGDAGATGNVPPPTGYIQEIDNPFGKIIRIDPLQDGASNYTIPDNPFNDVSGAAQENYALGFRDPQTFSFAKDTNNETVLVTFDIGAEEREEVNLVRPGDNHGWVRWEGTYELDPSRPIFDETNTTLSFPVAEYDHATGGFAIAGGMVVTDPNDPSFRNQVIFGDLVRGKIFHADYADMLAAETAGEQATIFESQVSFDGNTGTFSEVRGGQSGTRGDARFGTDEAGNVYIVSKRSDVVYATGLVVADSFQQDLVLTVNRESGEVIIRNPNTAAAISIDTYQLGSASGSLDEVEWESLAGAPTPGWQQAPNSNSTGLAEFNPNAGEGLVLSAGASVSIGKAYDTDPTAAMIAAGFGNDYQDVTFDYGDAASNSLVLDALVEYIGQERFNNLVLEINTSSGQVTLINESALEVKIDLLQISSDMDALDPNDFDALAAGWDVVPGSTSSGLAQLFPGDGTPGSGDTIASGETFDLGMAFDPGNIARDIDFVFHIVGDAFGFAGEVRYLTGLTGDYNDDGVVNIADYTVWRDNLGANISLPNEDPTATPGVVTAADYEAWKSNFGASTATVATASQQSVVPEPCSFSLVSCMGAILLMVSAAKHKTRSQTQ